MVTHVEKSNMPTPTEILNPNMKYCQKYDIHCPCQGCDSEKCLGYRKNICDNCQGPLPAAEAKKVFNTDNLAPHMCLLLYLSHVKANGGDIDAI